MKASINNFSKYEFVINGQEIAVYNKNTQKQVAPMSGKYRLTNDNGDRETIAAGFILENAVAIAEQQELTVAPAVEPEITYIEPTEQPAPAEEAAPAEEINLVPDTNEEGKLPAIEGEISLDLTKAPEGAKAAKAPKAPKEAKPRTAKLTEADAVKIRERIASGEKQSVIAKDYNVHQSTISDIKAGRLYPTDEHKAAKAAAAQQAPATEEAPVTEQA